MTRDEFNTWTDALAASINHFYLMRNQITQTQFTEAILELSDINQMLMDDPHFEEYRSGLAIEQIDEVLNRSLYDH